MEHTRFCRNSGRVLAAQHHIKAPGQKTTDCCCYLMCQASDGRFGFLADGIHQDGKAVPLCPHWQQLHPRRQFRGAGPYNRQIGPILLTKRGLFLSCLEHNVWLKSPCQRHIIAIFFLLECSAIKFENAQQVAKSFEHAFNLNTRCYFTFLSEPMPNAPPPHVRGQRSLVVGIG